ncbi:hypothetical protein [Streptomyces sp. JJ36]|uniref:hypothetical protein n=1 Tax=Streptomyces sp. JJ36 TaxID=2736645 RepID=UPI001F3BDE89|nr:hypothetical protein [Streptomyces sp. JJ36]MCF6526332.1 hypothetical protein [Streptomyces sp. JJ36]
MRGAEELSGADGPVAVVRLPDGQAVLTVVRGRRQEADGSWWYELELPLFTRAEAGDGRLRPEPEPVSFFAPGTQDVVLAVPGEDYSGVPTWRHPAAVRREARRRRLGRPRRPLPWDP